MPILSSHLNERGGPHQPATPAFFLRGDPSRQAMSKSEAYVPPPFLFFSPKETYTQAIHSNPHR